MSYRISGTFSASSSLTSTEKRSFPKHGQAFRYKSIGDGVTNDTFVNFSQTVIFQQS